MESTPFYRLHRVLCLLLFNWYLFVLEVHAAEGGRHSGHLSRDIGSSGGEEPRTSESRYAWSVGGRTPVVHAAPETRERTVAEQLGHEAGIPASVTTGLLHEEAGHVPDSAHQETQGHQSPAENEAPTANVPLDVQRAADPRETGPFGQGQRGDSTRDPVPLQTSASAANQGAENAVVSSDENRLFSSEEENFDYWNPVLALRSSQGEMDDQSPLVWLRQYYRAWPSVFTGIYLFAGAVLLASAASSLQSPTTAHQAVGGAYITLGIICVILGMLRARKIERRRRFP